MTSESYSGVLKLTYSHSVRRSLTSSFLSIALALVGSWPLIFTLLLPPCSLLLQTSALQVFTDRMCRKGLGSSGCGHGALERGVAELQKSESPQASMG